VSPGYALFELLMHQIFSPPLDRLLPGIALNYYWDFFFLIDLFEIKGTIPGTSFILDQRSSRGGQWFWAGHPPCARGCAGSHQAGPGTVGIL